MIPFLLFRLGAPNPHGFIAQVPVEVLFADVPAIRAAQVPVEVASGALGTYFQAQLVVEVLRSMHCIIPGPPKVPVSVCPPVDLTGVASGGCVATGEFTGTASEGCVSAVDPL